MSAKVPLKILVADDDYDDRELLKFLFNKNELFELVGCYTLGTEVIDEIVNKKNVPDILLIDMYMPIISGSEVITLIEKSGVAPQLQKFIISTSINPIEQERHLKNSSITFIRKPVSLTEINDLPGIILESLNHNNNTKI